MHRLADGHLLAICVLAWGTTWYAITFQIGATPPEVGVALRFAIAGGVVLAWCRLRRVVLRFSWREHARLALQGAFMYGVSYLCVYHAERYVVSGLVAVGYSASPLVSGLGARLLYGVRVTRRFVLGGVLGLAGVTLIFWPEFDKAAGRGGIALGATLTIAAVLLSAVGSLSASRNREHGMPFWPALGFGMLYGAFVSAMFALGQGHALSPPALLSWWLALAYLSLIGSVLSFACFLTLQERIGPGPAGSVGVLTTLLALLVSVVFEGFAPDSLTYAGVTLAVLGNVLMLRRGAPIPGA